MVNELQRFRMLLWIEIRRCQAGFAAIALIVIELIALSSRSEGVEGIVLWNDVMRIAVDAHMYAGPLGAAFAVWAVGRSRRRGMDDQEESLPGPAGTSALMTTIAVAGWMVAAHLALFLYLAVPAWRSATWGGPDVPSLLASALAIVACVAIGSLISRFGRSVILAPVTMVALFALMVYISDMDSDPQSARLLPVEFFDDPGFSIEYRTPLGDVLWFSAWLAAAACVIGGIALLLRSRSLPRLITVAVATVLAATSASQVIAESGGRGDYEMVDAVPVCEMASGINVCLHPAFSVLLDDVVDAVNRVLPQFAGLSGVPTTIYQQEEHLREGIEQEPGAGVIHVWGSGSVERSVADLFARVTSDSGLMGSPHDLNASQCVIGAVLTSTLGEPDCIRHGFVSDSVSVFETSGSGQMRIDQPEEFAELESWSDRMQEKVDSFSALTPEARQAWLIANWDDLRSGNLTLEDIP
jgi:hypothetical protein